MRWRTGLFAGSVVVATAATVPGFARVEAAGSCSGAFTASPVGPSQTGNLQTCTVDPGTASLTITAAGGAGGSSGANAGGSGAILTATFPVSPNETLAMLVGSQGGSGAGTGTSQAGGGGGGSFVWIGTTFADAGTANNLLIAAGGGGGSVDPEGVNSNCVNHDASPNHAGNNGCGGFDGTGGTAAQGGGGGTDAFNACQDVGGGGGGGLLTDGGNAQEPNATIGAFGGASVTNGGQGGGLATCGSSGEVTGGFGGGASGSYGGGGGGGYGGGGGGGGADSNGAAGGSGGGGGSFIRSDATNPQPPGTNSNGDGKVSITENSLAAVTPEAPSILLLPAVAGVVLVAYRLRRRR
jgi:hypothetical protein